jgi:hypothetical protein
LLTQHRAASGPHVYRSEGTAGDHVIRLFEDADPTFAPRMLSGLASGEGLIHHVRDAVHKGDDVVDEGVSEQAADLDRTRVLAGGPA